MQGTIYGGRNVHVKTRQLAEAVGVNNLTRVTLAWELHEEGVSTTKIAKRLGRHRETVGVWLKGIRAQGLESFLESYAQAKKGPRKAGQVDPVVKRLVWRLREREHDRRESPWDDCCGQKIAYFLSKKCGIKLSVTKIYQILAEKYQLRSKWKKNKQRGPVPKALAAREVIQMDSIMFGEVYALTNGNPADTAVDIFSREADILLVPALTAHEGYLAAMHEQAF